MFAQLQTAAKSAQRIFALMSGVSQPTASNFTLGGTSYQGVLSEISASADGTATGFETVRTLQIVAERTQFASKPDASTRPAVVALGSNWLVTEVRESPLHYFLLCLPQ